MQGLPGFVPVELDQCSDERLRRKVIYGEASGIESNTSRNMFIFVLTVVEVTGDLYN